MGLAAQRPHTLTVRLAGQDADMEVAEITPLKRKSSLNEASL